MQAIMSRMAKQHVLSYSTGNHVQHLMVNHNGKEYEKNIYMDNWITSLYSRNQHNVVSQLYLNKQIYKKKKKNFFSTFLESGGKEVGNSWKMHTPSATSDSLNLNIPWRSLWICFQGRLRSWLKGRALSCFTSCMMLVKQIHLSPWIYQMFLSLKRKHPGWPYSSNKILSN